MTCRAIICGGRDYSDFDKVVWTLDHFVPRITFVIHGLARGTDSLASRWATLRGVPQQGYAAQWAQLGKRAGPARNERMRDESEPDCVIAFPGGVGMAHMVRIARAKGIFVYEVR